METFLLRVFQRQVELQCKFLLTAARGINNGLQQNNPEHVFYALQNLLNANANIAKALWGGGGKKAAERKPLRDSIGVDDTSPLRDVNMRNNFEHFDERLDRWWRDSTHHNHFDIGVGPDNIIVGFADIDRFRHFNPQSTDVIFWGERFNVQQIVNEVQKILPKLQAEAGKPHWEKDAPTPGA